VVNVDDAGSMGAITGVALQGATLSAGSITDIDGGVTGVTYQWQADGNAISGATGSSYTLTQAEVGKAITVVATYTDAHGPNKTATSAATAAVVNVDDAGSMGAITGAALQGATLSAGSITDIDGGVTGVTYQWQADGNATGSSYTLTQAEVGKAITVVATYTDAHGPNKTATSAATAAVVNVDDAATGELIVTGTAEEGGSLTAVLYQLQDVDGSPTVTYRWEEYVDGAWTEISIPETEEMPESFTAAVAPSASSSTFSIPSNQSHVGKVLRVVATTTDALGGTTVFTGQEQTIANVDDAATGSLVVYGAWEEGGTLTASLDDVWDADGETTVSYVWQMTDGEGGSWSDIPGQTAPTLSIPNDQSYVGKLVRVVAVTTDALGGITTFVGTDEWTILNVDDAGSIGAITGNVTQGATLTAGAVSDPDGAVSGITYQWKADNSDISGAIGSTYTLTQADVGKAISLAVTYSDPYGSGRTVWSSATTAVTDLIAPTIDAIVFSGTDASGASKSGALVAGDLIKVVLTTSEPVFGWSTTDHLKITVGETSERCAAYLSSNGNQHTFAYTVQNGDSAPAEEFSVDSVVLGSSIADASGNPLGTALPNTTWLPANLSVDAVAPLLTLVEVTAKRGENNIFEGALRAGDVITLKAGYDETVVGDLTELPSFWIGDQERTFTASITSGSTRSWTYLVTAEDDGALLFETSLTDGLTDAAGNPAEWSPDLDFPIIDYAVDQWVTSAAVTAVHDNVGPVTGVVADGGQTDDTSLFITGTVEAGWTEGDVIKVYDGESMLGVVGSDSVYGNDSMSMTWSYQDTRTLSNGHVANYKVKVVDWANNESTSDAYSVTVSIPLGATINVTSNASLGGVSGKATDPGIASSYFEGLNTITGTAGNDSIRLSNALTVSALALLGAQGDDSFNIAGAISGTASIDGGSGNDSIVLSGQASGSITIQGGDGNDQVLFTGQNNGTYSISGGAGNDSFTFSSSTAGQFTIQGGDGNDSIDASAVTGAFMYVSDGDGQDTVVMGAGNDTVLTYGAGDDTYIGGGGVDVLTGVNASTALNISITAANASSGADGIVRSGVFTGGDSFWGFESIVGGSGNDTFSISASTNPNVTLNGGAGNDRFIFSSGTVGAYTLSGGDGDDSVDASTSAAALLYVTDGSGIDTVRLGGGNDTVLSAGAGGGDAFTGGSGTDVLSHATLTAAMAISITAATTGGGATGTVAAAAGGTADSFAGFESIIGGTGNDTFNISANIGNVTVSGGNGNDSIVSTSSAGIYVQDGNGADTVTLGSGNDTVYTGGESLVGNDSFTGAAGTDVLSYAAQTTAVTVAMTAGAGGGGAHGTVVSSTGTGTDSFFGFESIVGGSGHDSFVFSGVQTGVSVDGAAGNDSFNVTATLNGAYSVSGGAGNDHFAFSGVWAGTNFLAELGAGNDTFVLTGTLSALNFQVELGAGNDSFDASGMNQNVGFSLDHTGTGAAGNDVFKFVTGNYFGNDTISIQDAEANYFYLGNGFDKVTLQALSQASAGGGLGVQTIESFEWSNDKLILQGFWSSSVVNSMTSSNLSQYVQLSGNELKVDMDGNGSAYGMQTVAILYGATSSALSTYFNDEFKVIA
jgi:RTX calcium-binding nonapeptide repeat (4 copies)